MSGCPTFNFRASPSGLLKHCDLGPGVRFGTFAGDTIDIFDPITGEAHAMKLFVGDGASNYTCAEACPSESLPTHEPWRYGGSRRPSLKGPFLPQ